jgi:hypothetical protein
VAATSRGRKLGINLEPVVNALNSSIERLERQLPVFAQDRRKTRALRRSIATLQAALDRTTAICPTEEEWFGVPVRDKVTRG